MPDLTEGQELIALLGYLRLHGVSVGDLVLKLTTSTKSAELVIDLSKTKEEMLDLAQKTLEAADAMDDQHKMWAQYQRQQQQSMQGQINQQKAAMGLGGFGGTKDPPWMPGPAGSQTMGSATVHGPYAPSSTFTLSPPGNMPVFDADGSKLSDAIGKAWLKLTGGSSDAED